MKIEIGNRSLKEMTPEELIEIVIIEGCSPVLTFWNKPEITRFSNKTFSDTHVIDYVAYRKEDNMRSSEYTFFFNFEEFRFHYVRDYERGNKDYRPNGNRIGLATLRYLIKRGFDVPIYLTSDK